MNDLFLNWNGDLDFGPSGDLRAATDVEFACQRLARRLLTSPALLDSKGQIVQIGGNLFNQGYGAGVAGYVDAASSGTDRAEIEALIRATCKLEPVIDQNKPVTVTFFTTQSGTHEVAKIEFSTIKGQQGVLGVSL